MLAVRLASPSRSTRSTDDSGTSAVWCMQLRRTAEMSGGAEAVRLSAMCWSARDWQAWQVPVPVTISDQARSLITAASKAPDV